MSRFQKIFLATALVVVGFGVAKFLGQPVKLPETLQAYRSQSQSMVAGAQSAAPKVEKPREPASGVRLVPDAQVTGANSLAAITPPVLPTPPLVTESTPKVSPPPRTFELAPFDSPSNRDIIQPHAALRNEAPRPVGIDPQSPAAIRRTPAVADRARDPFKVAETPIKLTDAPSAPANWPAPQLMTADYSTSEPAANAPPAAIAASFSQAAPSSGNSQFAPPPWPAASDDSAEPRTHIVVDGDTLEKLAGRYLSDPQRGHEIFELNRAMLASPDLLPIGAELKIPDRVASIPRDRQVWQPNSSFARSSADASQTTGTTVAPVQPASNPTGIIPRAQLSRPLMVE